MSDVNASFSALAQNPGELHSDNKNAGPACWLSSGERLQRHWSLVAVSALVEESNKACGHFSLSCAFKKEHPFRIGWLESFSTFSSEGKLYRCLWGYGNDLGA